MMTVKTHVMMKIKITILDEDYNNEYDNEEQCDETSSNE